MPTAYLNSAASCPHTTLFLLIARMGIYMESPLLTLMIDTLVLHGFSHSNGRLLDGVLGIPFIVSERDVQRDHVIFHCDLEDNCYGGVQTEGLADNSIEVGKAH